MFSQFVLLRITINGFFIPVSFQLNNFFSNNLIIIYISSTNNIIIINLKNSQHFCHLLHLFFKYFCHFLHVFKEYFCHQIKKHCYINIAYLPFFIFSIISNSIKLFRFLLILEIGIFNALDISF